MDAPTQEQVIVNGMQLAFGPTDDVAADHEAARMHGRRSDSDVDLDEGLSVWSTGSLNTADLTEGFGRRR